MSSKRFVLLLAGFLILCIASPTTLFSQSSSTASVAGTVTDQKGAAVPNATVELLDTATNGLRTQT
ncbi:MAG TPA: carboxypeptidase-like regulatory domain-containing protein, partial [Nitrososphaera sp.]|nr:carboxypeptidase-like regulatory domain-containing protein [Nitrososphaera sp.]